MGGGRVTQDISGRFADLKTRLDQLVQHKALAHWEDSEAQSSAHDSFLAFSWTGSLEYWIAHAYTADPDAIRDALGQQRRYRNNPDALEAAVEAACLAEARKTRARFKDLAPGPHACERFVFFKTSNILPPSLMQMAPALEAGFLDHPLHTYFVIGRDQEPVPSGQRRQYSPFRVHGSGARTQEGVARALAGRAFPAACPALSEAAPRDRRPAAGPGLRGLAVPAIMLALVLAGAAAWFFIPTIRHAVGAP